MMFKKTLLFFAVLLGISTVTFADGEKESTGYNLQFKVVGIPDKTCKLAYYFADKQYLKDTVIAQNGAFVFRGDETLPGGIYIVILPNNQYFEIMVDQDQDFRMETDTTAYVGNMKVTGSEDNKLFYDYLKFINPKQKDSKELRDKMDVIRKELDSLKKENKKIDSTEFKLIKTKLEAIDEEVKNFKIDYMKKYPENILGKVFRTSKEVEIPEAPKLPNGKKDSTFAFKYYKSHFFDDIDFSDARLLRTPVFYSKIRQYLDKLTVQHPDSLITASDFLSEKARANAEVFKFIVQNITSHYEVEATKVVGLDAIFVHMVNKYYKTGQASWVDSTVMAKIMKRAKTLEPLLLGKVAPNLVLPDIYTQQPYALHDVKADYTVAYFWDPTCGHCKKVTPKLYEWWLENRDKKKVAVYGVNTTVNQQEIFDYLKEKPMDWIKVWDPYNTSKFRDLYDIYKSPEMYLLDKDKKIISKHIGVEDLDPLIKMWEKQQSQKAIQIKPEEPE